MCIWTIGCLQLIVFATIVTAQLLRAQFTPAIFIRGCKSRGIKCILPKRTGLCGEILNAWHHMLHPSVLPTHIYLQIEDHYQTEEINIDLQ